MTLKAYEVEGQKAAGGTVVSRIVDISDIRGKTWELPRQANRAILRAGVRPNRFWVVVPWSFLSEVDPRKTLRFALPWRSGPSLETSEGPRIFSNLIVASSRSLTPSWAPKQATFNQQLRPASSQLYLLELADLRAILPKVILDKNYNLIRGVREDNAETPKQVFDFQEHSLNAGDPWAWKDVLTDILDRVTEHAFSFSSYTADFYPCPSTALPNTGDTQLFQGPVGLDYAGRTASQALTHLFRATGSTLVPHDDGTFSVVSLNSVEATLTESPFWDDFLQGVRDPNDDGGLEDPDPTKSLKPVEPQRTEVLPVLQQGLDRPIPSTFRVYYPGEADFPGADSGDANDREQFDRGPRYYDVATSDLLADLATYYANHFGVTNTYTISTDILPTECLWTDGYYDWRQPQYAGVTNRPVNSGAGAKETTLTEYAFRELVRRTARSWRVTLPFFPAYQISPAVPIAILEFSSDFSTYFLATEDLYFSLYQELQQDLWGFSFQEEEGETIRDKYDKKPPRNQYAYGKVTSTSSGHLDFGLADIYSYQASPTLSKAVEVAVASGVSFCNLTGGTLSSGDLIHLHWDSYLSRWAAVPVSQSTTGAGTSPWRHGYATLSAALTTSGTGTVTGYRGEQFADTDPPTSGVANPYALAAPSGSECVVAYVPGSGWKIVAVSLKAGTPFTCIVTESLTAPSSEGLWAGPFDAYLRTLDGETVTESLIEVYWPSLSTRTITGSRGLVGAGVTDSQGRYRLLSCDCDSEAFAYSPP